MLEPPTPGDIPALNSSVAPAKTPSGHRGCWTPGGGWDTSPTAGTLWLLQNPLLPPQDWGFPRVPG